MAIVLLALQLLLWCPPAPLTARPREGSCLSRSDSRNWLEAKISAQILGAFFFKMPQRGGVVWGGVSPHQNRQNRQNRQSRQNRQRSRGACCQSCFSRANVCCHCGWQETAKTAKTVKTAKTAKRYTPPRPHTPVAAFRFFFKIGVVPAHQNCLPQKYLPFLTVQKLDVLQKTGCL